MNNDRRYLWISSASVERLAARVRPPISGDDLRVAIENGLAWHILKGETEQFFLISVTRPRGKGYFVSKVKVIQSEKKAFR